jgi:hypothetical protein
MAGAPRLRVAETVTYFQDLFLESEELLAQHYGGGIAESLLQVIIGGLQALAKDDDMLEDGFKAANGWLFQAARRIQSYLKPEDIPCGGAFYAPLGLYFIEQVSSRRALSDSDVDWNDRESVEFAFESAWVKVRFAEGQDLIHHCLEMAKRSPCTMLTGMRGRVISVCYYLQKLGDGKTFFLPLNDEVSEILGTSRVTLGNCLKALEGSRLISLVRPHVAKVKARTFRMDTSHPDILPGFK